MRSGQELKSLNSTAQSRKRPKIWLLDCILLWASLFLSYTAQSSLTRGNGVFFHSGWVFLNQLIVRLSSSLEMPTGQSDWDPCSVRWLRVVSQCQRHLTRTSVLSEHVRIRILWNLFGRQSVKTTEQVSESYFGLLLTKELKKNKITRWLENGTWECLAVPLRTESNLELGDNDGYRAGYWDKGYYFFWIWCVFFVCSSNLKSSLGNMTLRIWRVCIEHRPASKQHRTWRCRVKLPWEILKNTSISRQAVTFDQHWQGCSARHHRCYRLHPSYSGWRQGLEYKTFLCYSVVPAGLGDSKTCLKI